MSKFFFYYYVLHRACTQAIILSVAESLLLNVIIRYVLLKLCSEQQDMAAFFDFHSRRREIDNHRFRINLHI